MSRRKNRSQRVQKPSVKATSEQTVAPVNSEVPRSVSEKKKMFSFYIDERDLEALREKADLDERSVGAYLRLLVRRDLRL